MQVKRMPSPPAFNEATVRTSSTRSTEYRCPSSQTKDRGVILPSVSKSAVTDTNTLNWLDCSTVVTYPYIISTESNSHHILRLIIKGIGFGRCFLLYYFIYYIVGLLAYNFNYKTAYKRISGLFSGLSLKIESLVSVKNTRLSLGGGEGSRTPVRKSIRANFSGRSFSFKIPSAGRRKAGFRFW